MSVRTRETDEDLITRWIAPNPHKPGAADMRIQGQGVAVWAIIEQIVIELVTDNPWVARRLPHVEVPRSLVEEVARAYSIAPDAVRAALTYYQHHPDEIEARIILNRSSPEESR